MSVSRFGELERRAHRVEVVLANEQHRELPQRGEIQRFVELAFGDRAVAEEARRHRAGARSILSASATPTASGRPPATIALPP